MRKSPRPPLKAPIRLGEFLASVLKTKETDPKVLLSHLQYRWSEIVGPLLSRKSLPVKMGGNRLIIGVAGSAWANELEFMKLQILEKIRKDLPDLPIDEIRFQVRL